MDNCSQGIPLPTPPTAILAHSAQNTFCVLDRQTGRGGWGGETTQTSATVIDRMIKCACGVLALADPPDAYLLLDKTRGLLSNEEWRCQ